MEEHQRQIDRFPNQRPYLEAIVKPANNIAIRLSATSIFKRREDFNLLSRYGVGGFSIDWVFHLMLTLYSQGRQSFLVDCKTTVTRDLDAVRATLMVL